MDSTLLAVPTWVAAAVVVLTAVAADLDSRTRRIPNRLTAPALLAGLLAHAIAGGPSGLGHGALGALVAGGLLMPGWLLGFTGAGDVKLMAAVGAWLAWPLSLVAALASLIAGGVLAFAVAVRHRSVGRSLWGAAMIGAWATTPGRRVAPPPVTTGIRFPFAGAIFAGSLISLWVRL